MSKTRGLKLTTWEVPDVRGSKRVWRVEEVTDSTEYNPGDMLVKSTVDALCRNAAWKVTIKPLK